MADPIYLIHADGRSVRLEPSSYDSEDEFQGLLEHHPELLAGEQIDRDDARRWLLVGREIGLAESEDGDQRWLLDHLFVDQDAIPTLVEVKRQSDPRLRREVVGQVLDYASHARFWTTSFLEARFQATCAKLKRDPSESLKEFLAAGNVAPEAFWPKVQEHLRSGDMRLIFLADSVPRELQQIVEFLNEGMTRTEVLAIEVIRYAGPGYTTHIPRVFGLTSEALELKSGSKPPPKAWDEALFFDAASSLPAASVAAVRAVYDAAKDAGHTVRWGRGATTGSFNIVLPSPCGRAMLTVLTDGKLWLNILWMYGSPLADKAQSLLRGLAKRLSVPDQFAKQPGVDVDTWGPKVADVIEALRAVRPEQPNP
ncbi:hypothetical protein [Anaeromyxobacter dehalogenans]|uniref:DUF4268 domain-containing protein n=1 Tax=Anaeromyxobacter dehalogenans (strain 2CP-C) TaxID=290397 RepID=Q2IGD3_ANADE|nr:hypothetical protein [Anaeromyxobacter dehalogenans]ABC83640.1 hypothetical protein Adeh_3875 [Anaeromyxobacter dehalogenans 2CP-C]